MAFRRSLDVDKGTAPQNGETDIAPNGKRAALYLCESKAFLLRLVLFAT
jgi:hypothetical protein